ncbi:MAG: SurA N-terminal domain-containing protein [Alphaproteobacteria bacterium]|nr:SurA N-terminal domain-containing protein [Alphaproteobacteria bacterium]
MLSAMRKMAGTTFAKIFLFGILILSFGAWGLADYVSSGDHPGNTAAYVGDREVSVQSLSGAYREQVLQLGLNPDQARSLGVANSVLDGLVAEALIDQHAASLGLTAGAQAVVQRIQSDPAFRSEITGAFDRGRYDAFLAATGQSEEVFVARIREEVARNQLLTSVIAGAASPAAMTQRLYDWRNETRTADALIVPVDPDMAAPTPDAIAVEAYYTENQEEFRRPEYRRATYVSLEFADLRDSIEIDESVIAAAYDARIAEFTQVERREIRQLLAPDEETARSAVERTRNGEDFVAVAEDLVGADAETVSLGMLSRDAIADEAVAEAAFALGPGEVSEPQEGLFGWFVVQAVSIEPGGVQSLDEVRERIRADLAADQAIEDVFRLSTDLDDQLGGGATLEEAAAALDLTAETAVVDQTGLLESGAPIGLSDPGSFLRVLYDLDPGDESLLEETRTDGYFVVRLDEIIDSRIPALSEITDAVAEAWQVDYRFERTQAEVDAVVSRLENGESVETIAAADGYTWSNVGDITRRSGGGALPLAIRDQLFEVEDGAVLVERAQDGYVVAQVRAAEEAAAGAARDEAVDAFGQQLAIGLSIDLVAQLRRALQDEYSVTVNQEAVDLVY